MALEKKANKLVIFDVRGTCSYTDYIMICDGRSSRQVKTIGSHIEVQMKSEEGPKPFGVEGMDRGHWVLIDYGDIVIHIFYEPVRSFYDLDGMWSTARKIELDVERA